MQRKSEITIILLIITSLLLGINIGKSNFLGGYILDSERLSKINEKHGLFTRRYVIEGAIDLSQNGDILDYADPFFGHDLEAITTNWYPNIIFHWKKIPVPQLTLDDIPSIKVYFKIPEDMQMEDFDPDTPFNKWTDNSDFAGLIQFSKVFYDEQCVYICYKWVEDNGVVHYFFNGEFKIVIVK